MRYVCVFALFIFFGCNSESKIEVQGHRGYRGLYPENSLIGFQKALEIGVHTLELDVVISKDDKVVVSHEPFMNHEIALDAYGNEILETHEKQFNLYQMPYDSITLYDCGTKIHPRFLDQKKQVVVKPLLRSVISLAETASENSVFYNIEIKSHPDYDFVYSPKLETYVELVLNIIKTEGIADRTTIQSFDVRALEDTKRQCPELKLALLIDETESMDSKLSELSFTPEIISPYFKLLNPHNVKIYHDKGFKIIPWTVNEIEDIYRMKELKVDGIISDYPERVIHSIHQ